MCAHQPQRSSKTANEEKRDKLAEIRMDESLDDEQVKRLTRKHAPWSDWIVHEYLPYWYWLGVLSVNVFFLMDVAQRYDVSDLSGRAGILLAFIAFTVAEYFVFAKLWPDNPFSWLLEKRE
jgi:hypothetical protein